MFQNPNHEKYGMLFDQAPTAMWMQQESTVIDANIRALELFASADRNGFVGKDILGFLAEDEDTLDYARNEAIALFRDVASGEYASVTWRFRKGDGMIIDIHADMGRIVIDGDVFIHVVARDVTGLNETMQSLRYSMQQTEEFIANFSHELRTSLFSILGFTSILRKEETILDIGQVREFLSILNVETLKISSLIEDVLSISRINAGISAKNRRPVDLMGVLEEMVIALAPHARQKGIALFLNRSDEALTACVDPDAVKSAFVNIVDNALKFTPMQGSVELLTALDPERSVVSVQVSDSGIGIPARDLPHIFNKFYRVRRSGSDSGGYGLGLAIARQVVEENYGSITVESEEGKGSVFSVEFPLFNGSIACLEDVTD
jgi:signal transduction histidine kinase